MESTETENSLKTLAELVKEQNLKHEEEILQVKLQKQENSQDNKELISILNSIFKILSEQLSFQKSSELQKEIAGQVTPVDYQEEIPSIVQQESYSKEAGADGGGIGGLFGAYGIFSMFKDGLKSLLEVIKNVGTSLMEFLGIGKLLEPFKSSLGGIISKAGEFLRALSPTITRFTALAGIIYTVLQGLEKFGEWFRSIAGLPSIQNDAFNMSNYTGENPQHDRPMTEEQLMQERINPMVGGESARREGEPASAQPMTQETFEKQMVTRGSKVGASKGRDKLMSQTFDAFVNAGFSENQAKSLVAEVGREGSFNPENVFGYHVDPQNKAVNVGMFSWQKSRGKDLEKSLSEKGLIKDGKIERSQETLNEMAKFAKKEMETNPGFSRTKKQFLENPNIGSEEAAEVLGKNYIKWRYEDPRYVSGHANRKYFLKEMERIQQNPSTETEDSTKTASKENSAPLNADYSQVKEELQGRKSHKSVDVENLDAEYSSNVLNFMKDFEKETGKKVNITSGYRPPTDKEKSELGSVATTQRDVKKGAGKMAASEYGSMHGMGAAGDLTIEGYSASAGAKNSMNNMPAEYKKVWKDLAEKHNLAIPLADNPNQNEWWHIEKSGEKRGGAAKAGLKGEEYTNYIKSKSLQSAIEGKGIYAPSEETKIANAVTNQENKTSYTKLEKELPEGRGYSEEESEMEEIDEPTLSEPTGDDEISQGIRNFSRAQRDIDQGKPFSYEEPTGDDEISPNEPVYKNFFEEMISHLEKMVSFTQDIKETDEEMLNEETTAKKETASTKTEEKSSAAKEEYYQNDQLSKESSLYAEKESLSNFGSPTADNLQPPTSGLSAFGGIGQGTVGGFGQNPFGSIQNVLGGIGSAVSVAQQMGNIGKYKTNGGMTGGIYGAQGTIGGIQGVLSQIGQQSPMLGGLGQVLGSVGSVMNSVENVKNMGKYGGVLGGINAASGAVGAAGNIFNSVGGMFGASRSAPSPSGDISASTKKVGQALGSTPIAQNTNIGDSISNFFGGINGTIGTATNFGGAFGSLGSAPSTSGDISASTKKVGQALGSTPYVSGIGDSISNFFGGMFGSSESTPFTSGDISASTKKVGQALGSTPYVSDMGIGSDSAAINSKYSMIEDSPKRGFSLENMTRSVETTKEENMIPPEPSPPVTIQQGGKGGGGISGGSADNPPSGGVMGMDIGVRNEEPTLLRAQYGSVRIV